MESKYFRSRLPNYTEIMSCLSRMASAIDTLVQSLPKEAPFRLHLRAELEKAHAAIADCIGVFADAEADSSGRTAAIIAMKESSAQWREKLHALRQTDLPQSIPVEQVLHISGHALSLEEIVEQLSKLGALIDSLPTNPLQPSREALIPVSPPLDPFWIRNGIKACIAVIAGLIMQKLASSAGSIDACARDLGFHRALSSVCRGSR